MLNRRGVSRAVVLLALIALVLIIAIAVPVVQSKKEDYARSVDDLYVKAAEDDAYLRWVQADKPFTAIYDSENKRFVDTKDARKKVTAYGTSKDHVGMVVFVKVDDKGNITTRWVNPESDTSFK